MRCEGVPKRAPADPAEPRRLALLLQASCGDSRMGVGQRLGNTQPLSLLLSSIEIGVLAYLQVRTLNRRYKFPVLAKIFAVIRPEIP